MKKSTGVKTPRIQDTQLLDAAFACARETSLSEMQRFTKAIEVCVYSMNNGFWDKDITKLIVLMASLIDEAPFLMPTGPSDGPVAVLERLVVVLRQRERKLNWKNTTTMLIRELINTIEDREAVLAMIPEIAKTML